MNILRSLGRRLRALAQKRQLDARMDDELNAHIAMQTQWNIEAGMPPEEARRAASVEFGGVDSVKEKCRDQRGVAWIENAARDFRQAVRLLAKSRSFTAVAVVTLSFGIGVNLALFSLLNDLFLRPRPFVRPQELWAIRPANSRGEAQVYNLCRPYYDELRRHPGAFDALVGYATIYPKLRTKEGWDLISAELVSGDYFSFLGVVPALGRGFGLKEDAKPGARGVAVLSHRFWRRQFQSDPDILGRPLTINGKIADIVGVAPESFRGLGTIEPDVWLPDSMEGALGEFTIYNLVGRLSEPSRAGAARDSIIPAISEVTSAGLQPGYETYGFAPDFTQVALVPAGRGSLSVDFGRDTVLPFLRFAGLVTALVLLISASNVANLLLARALTRRKEMATRLALGCSRRALIRQLLMEGALLAGLSAGGALLLLWCVPGVVRALIPGLPWLDPNLTPDLRVVLAAVVGALVVGVGFSLLPALQATRFDPFLALKDADGGLAANSRGWSLRRALIVAQIGGSLVLVCGANLCLRSMSKQLAIDVGFNPNQLAVLSVDLEKVGFTTNTAPPVIGDLLQRFSTLPGVEAVGVTFSRPFGGERGQMGVGELEGYGSGNGSAIMFGASLSGADSFRGLGLQMKQGRDISFADLEAHRLVAVVSESFVRRYWPTQNPLGLHVAGLEVIGVAPDVRLESPSAPLGPAVFMATHGSHLAHPVFLIRSRGAPSALLNSLRSTLLQVHPGLGASEAFTMRQVIRDSLVAQRSAFQLLGAFSMVALGLAMVGAYGVMSYLVTQRTREIGIRLAVGASRRAIAGLVIGSGLRLTAWAVIFGAPAAIVGAHLMRHLLFGVSAFDPVSLATTVALVSVSVLAASFLPAYRGSRVDPMTVLRRE